MKKLRLAIMGQKGNNLNDLESMDGKILKHIKNSLNLFLVLDRICAHIGPGVSQLTHIEVLQEDLRIQNLTKHFFYTL